MIFVVNLQEKMRKNGSQFKSSSMKDKNHQSKYSLSSFHFKIIDRGRQEKDPYLTLSLTPKAKSHIQKVHKRSPYQPTFAHLPGVVPSC